MTLLYRSDAGGPSPDAAVEGQLVSGGWTKGLSQGFRSSFGDYAKKLNGEVVTLTKQPQATESTLALRMDAFLVLDQPDCRVFERGVRAALR